MSVIIDSTKGITQASWTTAGRPALPVAGQVGYNVTLNVVEQYNGSNWETIPQWTTANRPVTPVAGYSGYNTDTKAFEFYNGTTWIGFNQSSLSTTASYLLVAGGGAGGSSGNAYYKTGGGGAGGLLTGTTTLNQNTTYFVTVGGGGGSGNNGNNTTLSGASLSTVTAIGGGYGGGGSTTNSGASGGSGGGAMASSFSIDSSYPGGSGTPGQGYAGGTSYFTSNTTVSYNSGAGGGGAGGVGGNGVTPNTTGAGGTGGNGVASSINGTSITYAGGGGGGGYTTGGTGGTGGGGAGGGGTFGANGATNTGSGGGGSAGTTTTVSSGGSGIAVISYPGSQVFTGGTVTTSGGNTIHTFTTSAALLPTTNGSTFNNSLRFRASASAYLSRTPSVAGNRQIMTYSFWVKRGALTADYNLTNATTDASNSATLYFNNSNSQTFDVFLRVGGTNYSLTTSQVFRDPSAWYHIVVAIDTTQATASNRTKVYVNGSQVQNFLTASYVPQNSNLALNNSVAQNIGGTNYYDGYMANIQFIDGQQLSAANFGTNNSSGVWVPIPYTGTYGTNGFFLNFGDGPFLTTSSNTGIGKDSSGNGNYWVTNNISVTAGSTFDLMTDVPTLTSATAANYCTLNPLPGPQAANIGLLSNANLSIANNAGATNMFGFGTIGITSDKYYWEVTVTGFPNANTNTMVIGICGQPYSDAAMRGYSSNGSVGQYFNGTSYSSYGASYTTNDIIGVAFDATNQTIEFYKNGVSQGQKTSIGTSGTTEFPWMVSTSTPGAASFNFGQRPFTYTPPSGYVALNTYNLTTPTILQGNLYMDATLYTGNSTGLTAVNQAGFKPDLVWIKDRTQVAQNVLTDSVRGSSKQLFSSLTNAEQTNSTYVTSFNSNGFTVGVGNSGTGVVNNTADNFVAWQWQAGQGTTSSNTSGSITSTVSVNASAGFSIVTYTGTNANATVGHGLGVAPKMIIIKGRSTAYDWAVYHASLGNTTAIRLNSTGASLAPQSYFWQNTTPTSSLIYLGSWSELNGSGATQVAYCWAEIAGFSKFGSYTGNGSTDGPFIYLGFRPKFLMVKVTSTTEDWYVWDSSRGTYNANTPILYPDLSAAESTAATDFLSNGFKPRTAQTLQNASGQTYIYAAFAENPFKYANAR